MGKLISIVLVLILWCSGCGAGVKHLRKPLDNNSHWHRHRHNGSVHMHLHGPHHHKKLGGNCRKGGCRFAPQAYWDSSDNYGLLGTWTWRF